MANHRQNLTGIAAAKQSRMNVSLYQAASALSAMDRWQETIAENLASSSVPGFKKQDFSFAAVQAGLHPVPGGAGASRAVQMSGGQASTNFQPGEFRITGVKTDLAIGSWTSKNPLPSMAKSVLTPVMRNSPG